MYASKSSLLQEKLRNTVHSYLGAASVSCSLFLPASLLVETPGSGVEQLLWKQLRLFGTTMMDTEHSSCVTNFVKSSTVPKEGPSFPVCLINWLGGELWKRNPGNTWLGQEKWKNHTASHKDHFKGQCSSAYANQSILV